MTQICRSKLQELIADVRKWDGEWAAAYGQCFYNSSMDYWCDKYAKKLEEAWERLEKYVSNPDGEPLGL